jgi:hypothetical protein
LSSEVRRSHEALKIAQLTIEKMKVEVAYLRRMKYGRSSERLEQPQPQLELVGGQAAPVAGTLNTQADVGGDEGLKSNVTSIDQERKKRQPKPRPGLREPPEHLPRRTVVHTPNGSCDCQACGAGLREIGQEVSEVLDYEPGTFHVVRHVRPKLAWWRNKYDRDGYFVERKLAIVDNGGRSPSMQLNQAADMLQAQLARSGMNIEVTRAVILAHEDCKPVRLLNPTVNLVCISRALSPKTIRAATRMHEIHNLNVARAVDIICRDHRYHAHHAMIKRSAATSANDG